MLAVGRLMRTE